VLREYGTATGVISLDGGWVLEFRAEPDQSRVVRVYCLFKLAHRGKDVPWGKSKISIGTLGTEVSDVR